MQKLQVFLAKVRWLFIDFTYFITKSINYGAGGMKVTLEMARIHAHLCGDGCVYVSNENRSPGSLLSHPRKKLTRTMWILCYTNTCPALLKEFDNDMERTYTRKAQYVKGKCEIRYRGTKYIAENLQLREKNSRNWKIPHFITHSSVGIRKAWVRAFFDDEATIAIDRKAILVSSVNKNGLIQIQRMLKPLGMQAKVLGPYMTGDTLFWRLSLRGNNVMIYKKRIGFNHPSKKEKLEKIMGRLGISVTKPKLRNF